MYVPKHTSWLHPIAIGFRILVRRVLKRGNLTSVADPRAKILRTLAAEVASSQGVSGIAEIQETVREVVTQGLGLNPNVDYYSAGLYYSLGIPVDLFTPIFAVSRMSGWTAHILEQYADNRIIRPESVYVGPRDLRWQPMDRR